MAVRSLTLKQARFVVFYLGKANGNATEAARLAGYSRPQDLGPRLVKKSQVRAKIDERLDGASISANEILVRLTDHATSAIGDFLKKNGRSFKIDMAKVRKSRCVKKIKQGQHGIEIELYDAQSALEKLGRYRGLWKATVQDDDIDPRTAFDEIRRRLDGLAGRGEPGGVPS